MELSQAGITDGAHWKRQRDTFYCKRTGCSFRALIDRDKVPKGTVEYIEDSYHITVHGEHTLFANEERHPKPLPEHVKAAATMLASSGLSGAALAQAVSAQIGIQIPAHSTRRLERDTVKVDYQASWGRMLPLLELLNASGFPTRWIPVENTEGNSLKFCYSAQIDRTRDEGVY